MSCQEIVERIRKYWADEGYAVKVGLVADRYDATGKHSVQTTKSDLINGLPAEYVGPLAIGEGKRQ